MPQPTKGPRLGGSPAHEKLLLANLATELFRHGKIKTTETKAKRGDLHSRRRVLTVVKDKDVVYALFDQIAPRYGNRPGGYTRITKTGPRKGDAAPMAVIELVEELQIAATTAAPARKSAPRKAAQQDKVEALAREDETPAATPASAPVDTDADQDAEPPISASGDKDAPGPGTQAEGEDTDKA